MLEGAGKKSRYNVKTEMLKFSKKISKTVWEIKEIFRPDQFWDIHNP